jgi:hypothetical protein
MGADQNYGVFEPGIADAGHGDQKTARQGGGVGHGFHNRG